MERADLSKIPSQQQEWPGRTADLNPQPDHGETSWVGRERLVGKRALITGGDSGIGRAIAVAFAKEGADVVISHLPEEADDARDTVELIRAEGRVGEAVASDLRDAAANKELAAKAVELLGGLDVLVCNAAYQMTHEELDEFPDQQVVRTFETNVFGAFWLAKALEDELKDGSIIITTSIQAFDPSENLLDYAATKAALNNLAVNMASELGPQNTRVNAVAHPGDYAGEEGGGLRQRHAVGARWAPDRGRGGVRVPRLRRGQLRLRHRPRRHRRSPGLLAAAGV